MSKEAFYSALKRLKKPALAAESSKVLWRVLKEHETAQADDEWETTLNSGEWRKMPVTVKRKLQRFRRKVRLCPSADNWRFLDTNEIVKAKDEMFYDRAVGQWVSYSGPERQVRINESCMFRRRGGKA